MDDLALVCKDLLIEEPFYGSLLLNFNKEVSKKIPTAGVGLEGVMYKLCINPEFWESLNKNEKKGLILHEVRHIAYFHLTDYKHLNNKEIANIAMDLTINQEIDDKYLPKGGCKLENFPELNLKKGEGTNAYYKKLMQANQDGSSPMLNKMLEGLGKGEDFCQDPNGGGTVEIPNHKWDDLEKAGEGVQKIVHQNMLKIMSEAVEEAKKNRGTIPGGIEEMLERLLDIQPPKFNWRQYLKRFVGTSTKSWTNKTKRKQSSRFDEAPGQREKEYSHILVAVDTSASVSTEELKEFLNEITHMYKTGHDVQIVLADTKINKQFKFNPRNDFEIVGRGGTDFNEVCDLYMANRRKYSCLIYVTDGECCPPRNYGGNILWVHSSKCSCINEELPGKKIKLN
jgi:predicted metal-dependent peptidase